MPAEHSSALIRWYNVGMKSLITKRSRSCRECGSSNLVDYKVWYHRGVENVDVYITEPIGTNDACEMGAEESYKCDDCGSIYHKKYTSPGCIRDYTFE